MSEKIRLRRLREVNLMRPSEKRCFNRALFDEVAPAYQRVTQVLSFGQDRRWKRSVQQWLPGMERPVCLDIACGTGDLTWLLATKYTDGIVVGLDMNRRMMAVGRERMVDDKRLGFVAGDMTALPLPDRSVDIITGGYAIRNAPSVEAVLEEVQRVLRPGGVAVFLDFSKPASKVTAAATLGLLRWWGRLWGRLFHRNADVYGYIASSLAHFPDRERLTHLMATHGLTTVRSVRRFLGIIEIRLVRREVSDEG